MVKKAEVDIRRRTARFEIMGSRAEPYIVEIKDFTSPAISAHCTCPYDKGICKHQVAALLYLQANFDQLADEYNHRFYPHLPEKETNQFIDEYLQNYQDFYPENFKLGIELANSGQVTPIWINPLLQHARLEVDRFKVEINDYLNRDISIKCSCMKELCEHKIASALWLKNFFSDKMYQKTRSHYLRQNNKFIMIGTIGELRSIGFNKNIPSYLPEEFQLMALNKDYIRLKLKVRYKYQSVEFKIRNNYVLSHCSCDDEVPGICKHQIAGINLLNQLDHQFFPILASDKAKELVGLFI